MCICNMYIHILPVENEGEQNSATTVHNTCNYLSY